MRLLIKVKLDETGGQFWKKLVHVTPVAVLQGMCEVCSVVCVCASVISII